MANDMTTTTFSSGTQIKSAEVNQDFDDVAQRKNAKAAAVLTSDQSIATGTETLLALATELYDPGGNFDNTATNYSFTVPITGYYQINLQVRCNSLSLGKFISARVKNGANTLAQYDEYAPGNQSTTANISKNVLLSASDVIKTYAAHDNGSNRDISNVNFVTFFDISLASV